MLDQIGCEGMGESVTIDWFPSDVFDCSTKITLQAHNSNYNVEDIQEILSNELTKLAVLKKGTTIEVIMPHLETPVKFEVIALEPASIVLCEGDEVVLDFIESLDSIARPPTPYPFDSLPTLLSNEILPSAPLEESFAPIIPEPVAPTLGGTVRETRYNPWRDKGFMPKTN
jgi:hypothetical protein